MMRVFRTFPMSLSFFLLLASLWGKVAAESTLNFPRWSAAPGTLTGVAIVNPTDQAAQVSLTAFNGSGDELAQTQLAILPGRQAAVLTEDLFAGVNPGGSGWFRAESATPGLTGFFLFLTADGTQLDGADLPSPARRIVFTEVGVGADASTELNLINPGNDPLMASLALVSQGGLTLRNLALNPRGAARVDVEDLFGIGQTAPGAYIVAEASGDLIGFELVRSGGADTVGLNARVGSQLLNSLYFPQIAVLGGIETELTLINRSPETIVASISAHRPDGSLHSGPDGESRVTRSLEPGQSLSEDLVEMFGFQGETSLQGWLEVVSPTQSLSGSLTYRVGQSGAAASVFPQSQGSTHAIFSHIATTLGFFTGVAGLNPGSLPADLRLVAVSADGRVLGSRDLVLQPGERFSRLVSDLIPGAAGQAGGFVFVRSSLPVFLTSLFGTVQGSVLANIPPQTAPPGFSPDAGIPRLRVNPPLAAAGPSEAIPFQAEGAVGEIDWSVIGDPREVGDISVNGLFQAPSSAPAQLPITILAESGTILAGAAVDLLTTETLVDTQTDLTELTYLPESGALFAVQVLTQTAPATTAPGADSVVYQISPPANREQVAFLEGESVSDMAAYRSEGGGEYLLLAGRASGSVLRLDPTSGQVATVAGGLNAPVALALDPFTGDLIVAEADRVSTVSRSLLEKDLEDLVPARVSAGPPPRQAVLFQGNGVGGVAVDSCGGNIFFSDTAAGRILERVRATGQVRVLASGLALPGQLTSLYRRRVGCPFAFHLVVAQQGNDQFALLAPNSDVLINPWFPSAGSDLILAPGLSGPGTVLVGQAPGAGGMVLSLAAADLYQPAPVNPPAIPRRAVSVSPGPDLEIGSATLDGSGQVTVPVRFRPGADDGQAGGSDEIGALVFSIDYDQDRLELDAIDGDQDGLPDAIVSSLPPGYSVFVRIRPDRGSGEINVVIADVEAPLQPIPEGALLSLTFSVRESASGSADLLFATTPAPSAADRLAQSTQLDERVGGTVTIVP